MTSDSLYINTELTENITLHPSQLNNEIYINLKNKLIDDYENKCLRNYGYITKIYEITEYKNAIIHTNNPLCSATFKLKYTCRLCVPLKNKIVVCEVDSMNKHIITLKNGPLKVIVTLNRINTDNFLKDNNNNLVYLDKNKNNIKLSEGSFVKIIIISILFNHGDSSIKSIGFLDSVANEDEIKNYWTSQFDRDDEYIDYTKYIENNNSQKKKKEEENEKLNKDNISEEKEEIADATQSTIVTNNEELKKKKSDSKKSKSNSKKSKSNSKKSKLKIKNKYSTKGDKKKKNKKIENIN